MPWGDGTGPWWLGRRDFGASGYGERNPYCMGRGMWARGSWRARAYGPWYEPFYKPLPAAPAVEMGHLEDVASQLEQDLKAIKEKIGKLRSTQ
jgi:hypothetical protein